MLISPCQRERSSACSGPNGSGKTTMLKIVAGLLTPTSGVVLVEGQPVGEETKSMISFLPENTYLPEWMTVDDCLDYFADFYTDFDMLRAREMLSRLNVPPKKRMKQLSKGTRGEDAARAGHVPPRKALSAR